MKIAIYNYMNTFITAEKSILFMKKHKLRSNRLKVGDWEQFIIIKLDNDKVAIKTFHGKYISAQKNGFLHCNRTKIGNWEKFDLIKNNDNTYSFKSYHGKYISFKLGLFYFLAANSNKISNKEKFILKNYIKERIKKEQNDIVELKKKIMDLEKQIPEKERKIQLLKDQYFINRKAYDENNNYTTELSLETQINAFKKIIKNNNIKIEIKNNLIIKIEKEEGIFNL